MSVAGRIARSVQRAVDALPKGAYDVSENPEVRRLEAESFWRRNPGWAKTSGIADAIRGAIDDTRIGKAVADTYRPTEFGVGQALLDQMAWQRRTMRQPELVWWMGMNEVLVGDGITAEAYVRTGRQHEVTDPGVKAWVDYIEKSDAIKRALGHDPADGWTHIGAIDRPPLAFEPTALSDAYTGVNLLKRLHIEWRLKPQARRAYWVAHDEAIKAASAKSRDLLERIRRDYPGEADFGDAWARSVFVHRIINPPAASHWSIPVQKFLLPQEIVDDHAKLTVPQRLFTKALIKFNELFPRAGAKVEEARLSRLQRSIEHRFDELLG